MSFPRAAGILLHPTSLPSRGGIGDFGPAAYQFADSLASARQGLWQVLPLGPLGYGNSPYSSTSAFAGNPLLISLERLASHGWIDRDKDFSPCFADSGPVAYDRVFATKMPLLFEAGRGFVASASASARERFERFCSENAWWLDDFVLFDALRARHKLASWNEWPAELAHREAGAMERARKELADDLKIRSALQFAFYEQWQALRRYCAERKIRIVGDVAIFVNYDSADVWMHRDLFRLNENLEPEVVSGVPPDFFSKTGQRWGNPLYRWDVMKAQGYEWWIQRLRWATRNCDYIRLDHFRGFDQFWEIPADDPTAINGRWVDGPRDDLFHKLREALGGLPFFAEDLGYITPAGPRPARAAADSGDGGAAVWFRRRRRAHVFAASRRGQSDLHGNARQRYDRGLVPSRRRGSRTAQCGSLSWTLRRWNSLGVHPRGADLGGRFCAHPAAGRAGAGQRSAHEHSQSGWRELEVASCSGTVHA